MSFFAQHKIEIPGLFFEPQTTQIVYALEEQDSDIYLGIFVIFDIGFMSLCTLVDGTMERGL